MLTDRGRLTAGETVRVEAAASGVSSLLVQVARAAGAHVIGLAGGERKLQLGRELGQRTVHDWISAVNPPGLIASRDARAV
jgi:NADPH:quinone reductase